MKTKFIRFSEWLEKRGRFSAAEMDTLNNAIVGEIICPRGMVVEVTVETRALLERFDEEGATA